MFQADLGQQFAGERGGARPRHASYANGRQHDVLGHRQVGKQVELLEHETDAGAQRVDVAARRMNVLPGHADDAALYRFQAVDGAYHRRLAGSGRSAHDHHLPRFHAAADAVQRVVASIPFLYFVEFYHGNLQG